MAVTNKLLIGLTSFAVVSVLAVGVGSVAFAENGNNSDTIVDKIASRFNVSKSEVQAVFDENRQERQAERQANFSKELQSAVDAGKLTADQKTLLENKMKENQLARESEITELKKWADDNNIDYKYILSGGRHGNNGNRLQAAVDAGSLTTDQKTKIEQKQAELEKTRQAKHDAMVKWAQENNIDEELLHLGKGSMGGNRGGPRLES